MPVRILVTARAFANVPGEHHDFLRRNGYEIDLQAKPHPWTAAELSAVVGEYEGAILGLDHCDASVIERATKLRVISRAGSGVDQIDLESAAQHNIVVTNTPGANRLGVAELTIGLMFALARNIPQVAAAARSGHWKRDVGFELAGKMLGIVGLGLIGKEVAARANALGMTVLGYDPFVTSDTTIVRRVDLLTLLTESHLVTLHCSVTPETENILD